MLNGKWKLRKCAKILSIVILLTFLKFPVFANPQTGQAQSLIENETRLYSDLEVDTLIDEISEAAHEAIEQAAGEAARAAALAALEREVVLSREVLRWKTEAETQKKAGRKNAVIVGLVCLLGGLAAGVGGTLYIGGAR
jgi:malate/lactate dehydrogenase